MGIDALVEATKETILSRSCRLSMDRSLPGVAHGSPQAPSRHRPEQAFHNANVTLVYNNNRPGTQYQNGAMIDAVRIWGSAPLAAADGCHPHCNGPTGVESNDGLAWLAEAKTLVNRTRR